MSVTPCIPLQAKLDLLNALLTGHTVKVALYLQANANFDVNSTVYSATGEISGTGYSAGGKTLAGFTVGSAGSVAYADWTDPVWNASTLTADAAVIYDASNGNHILAILTFGSTSSVNGDWTLQLPVPGATAVVRIA